MDDNEETFGIIKNTRRKQKNLDMSKYDIDEDIKGLALIIYRAIDVDSHEGTTRKQIIYTAFSLAAIECGKPFIPNQLAKIIELEPKKIAGISPYIQKARSLGYGNKIIEISPMDMIRNIITNEKELKIYSDYWESIKGFVSEQQPLLLACYILDHFKTFTRKEICSKMGISDTKFRNFIAAM